MKRILVGLMAISLLAGCGSSSSSKTDLPENDTPIAIAGEDFSVDEQTLVNLIGSGSDSDGSVVSYQWSQISGPAVTLENSDTENASFTAPVTTTELSLIFNLSVTDNQQATASDQVSVRVEPVNLSPTVSVVSPSNVIETLETEIIAIAEDEDGEIMSYLWLQVDGPDVGLTSEQAALSSITFNAPEVAAAERLIFIVFVTDNEGAESFVEIEFDIFDSRDVVAFNRLNDTGQMLCGNYALSSDPDEVHANNLDCELTEFPTGYPIPNGQDGHYGRDREDASDEDGLAGFRFLKLDQQGEILATESETWSCVLDQTTGLTWEVKTEGPEITAKHNRFTWYSSDFQTNGGDSGELNDDVGCAFEGKLCHNQNYWVTQNSKNICGSDNWRIPQPKELFGLVAMRPGNQTKIDSEFFPNIDIGNSTFWTSSSYSVSPESAFIVDFYQAKIYRALKSDSHGVLIVTSSPAE